MIDEKLLGVWTRRDENDEVRYEFRANGTMKMTVLSIEAETEYDTALGLITVKSLEPSAPANRLRYRIDGDLLTVWPPEDPRAVFVMKRI